MAKKITGYIKLQVPAGTANPAPPIGPALGQRGVNIMEFCKAFNAATQELEKGAPIPTVITVYADQLLVHDQNSARVVPPEEGGADPEGIVGDRQIERGYDPTLAARTDRRDQDEGSQRQRHRS